MGPVNFITDYLELNSKICSPKPKNVEKSCVDPLVLDKNEKYNYKPSCMLGTFENEKCVDNPVNGKCSFNTFNPATGKCDLPPKKKI